MRTISEKIQCALDEMTKAEHRLASHFLARPDDFAFLTLSELAESSSLSTTSALRFCRKLGFEGYKDFQAALRAEIRRATPGLPDRFLKTVDESAEGDLALRTFQADLSCLRETFELQTSGTLDLAARSLSEAKRVFTFGLRESAGIAHYAYSRLLSVRPQVFRLDGAMAESLLSLGEGDVCLVFLFRRYTKQTVDYLPKILSRGAKVVLVTSHPAAADLPAGAFVLPCQVTTGGIKNSYAGPLWLMDHFCSAVAILNGDRSLHHMQEAEALFAGQIVSGAGQLTIEETAAGGEDLS